MANLWENGAVEQFRALRVNAAVRGPLILVKQRVPFLDAEDSQPKLGCFALFIIYCGFYFASYEIFEVMEWQANQRQINNCAVALLFLTTSIPFISWLLKCINEKQFFADAFLKFPRRYQYWYSFCVFWIFFYPIDTHFKLIPDTHSGWALAIILAGPWSLILGMILIRNAQEKRSIPSNPSAQIPFNLYLGTSSGLLGELSHGAGIRRNQTVALTLPDAAQNILVLGGIGSGKTTRAVQPLLLQLLDQDSGGLIFDIKGDFKQAVQTLAAQVGREITSIGPEKTKMNLIQGLSPEVASSFLKSALLLNSHISFDPFWIDTAAELCKNALGVLSFIPGRYSLAELHTYLFDPAVRGGINDEAKDKMALLSERERRLLKNYVSYYETIFSDFDDKVQKGVAASVSQVLSPFNHPDLIDAFCTDSPDAPSMETVLNGTVYLVDMPLSRWGLGGKVAYTFIKLRFFNVMQRRNSEEAWDKERAVFFMCDEYQEIVSANRDGLSDLNFWDKSRSSKCIGIISAQAVSSFYAAVSHRDLADALLQNFRQKICFKTEDSRTIEMLNHLLGRVEVERVSVQKGHGSTNGLRSSTSSHHSVSRSLVEKQVINPQAFRTLGSNQAIALLSLGGVSADDVLECEPLFCN